MKYTRPHLSPELRARITPHTRRDRVFISAGVFFLALSALMVANLWPSSENVSLTNFKPELTTIQPEKQVLGIATEEESSIPEQKFTSYTVQSGDTLFNISQQYNIQWDLIAEINNLIEPYLLHGGQTLKIPQATTSQVPNKIYTIQSGDSLFSIARTYNITVNDIIAVNPNLQQSDLITVGQVIKLP